QHRRSMIVILIKEFAQAFHAVEFVLILFRTDDLPIGNVHIHDSNSGNVRRQQTRVTAGIVFRIAALNVGATGARNNSDAVIALLAKDDAIVADGLQLKQRKLIVRTFCFLNTKNVRLRGFEPPGDVRQARENRVNVPSSNLHFIWSASAERSGDGALDSYSTDSPTIASFTTPTAT